jgi:predicted nucleotidyltransferase
MFKQMNGFVTPACKTLTWLGLHYRDSFYVRELAKTLSISTGAVSMQLRELHEAGLVTREQKGRTVLYRATISHPLVREAKIFATLLEISPLMSDLETEVTRLILFGSCAVGEDSYESDIDLFIETTDRPAVLRKIDKHDKILSRKLSPLIESPREAAQLMTRDRPLYERIRRGKILAGEEL